MTPAIPRPPRRFPKVAAGRRLGFLAMLVLAGLARAAAGAGVGVCIGAALGSSPPAPVRIIPSIAILVLAAFGLRLLEASFAEHLGQSFTAQVRLRLLDAVRHLQGSRETNDGSHLARLVSDLNALRNWVSLGFAQMLGGGVALVALLVILAFTDTTAFWIACTGVAGVGMATMGITPLLRAQIRVLRRIRGRLTHRVVKAVVDPVNPSTARGIPRLQRQLTPAAVRQSVLCGCLRRTPELTHGLLLLLVAFLVTTRETHGQPTPHPVTTLLFLGLVATALRELVHAWSHRLAFLESRRRIVRLLRSAREAAPVPPESAPEPIPVIDPSGTARA